MNILLLLLPLILQLLPKLLDWITQQRARGGRAGGRALAQLNEAVWYCSQIALAAPAVGATKGGVPPDRAGPAAAKKAKKGKG